MEKLVGRMPGRHSQRIFLSDPPGGCGAVLAKAPSSRDLQPSRTKRMARKNTINPFTPYVWLAEAGWVFAMHSAQLWADPAKAGARLVALGAEKQKAFAEGAIKAGAAAISGASPGAGAKLAMAPARRRVRANARKIQKG